MIKINKLVFLLILFLCACSAKPTVIETTKKFSGEGDKKIYIVSHGWHTGFILPSKDVFIAMPELSNRFENTFYIEFGWGDKGFYQTKEVTASLALRAILMPTDSVVHVVGIDSDVIQYFAASDIESLFLTDDELVFLLKFIASSFAKDINGNVIATKSGIYGDSQFYKGVGDYYLMNTCNKWTAKGLKSFGMDIAPTFKLTSDSIMSYLGSQNGS